MQKNFAIIGCGRIGQRHAEQIIQQGNLVAVCDINHEKANALATQYSTRAYYTIEDFLKAGLGVDVLAVCTPNGLHAIHSIKALQNGLNVLCEKPLCLTAIEGKEMINAARLAEKKLFVVKQNRYNPPVEFLKNLLKENKLGKIYSFQINCFWNRPPEYYIGWKGTKQLDGGTLYTQFSHFIDLLFWLLGEVADVKKLVKNMAHPNIEFEDCGVVLFDMVNGAVGSLNYTVNSFAKNMEGSFTIFGEKGTIKIGGQYLNELEYFEVDGMERPILSKGNNANSYGFYQGSMSNHNKVYQNLVLALNDSNHLFASAEEGLKTVEIIERIYATN